MRPPSKTTIRSALAIVESLWATKRTVVCRNRRILSTASFTWMGFSMAIECHFLPYSSLRCRVQWASRLIQCEDKGFLEERPGNGQALSLTTTQTKSANSMECTPLINGAMQTRRHSLSVSNVCGIPHMNSQFASLAASSICSRVASGLPNAMFEAMVPENKIGSCGTTPMTDRHEVVENSRISKVPENSLELQRTFDDATSWRNITHLVHRK